jgi:hypothetical protein
VLPHGVFDFRMPQSVTEERTVKGVTNARKTVPAAVKCDTDDYEKQRLHAF